VSPHRVDAHTVEGDTWIMIPRSPRRRTERMLAGGAGSAPV